jgi:hypothetical protein
MIRVAVFAFLFTGFAFAQSVATAPINDIPGTAHVVTNVTFPAALTTNDVCAIVTNVVGGFTPWEFRFSSDAVAEAAKGWNLELEYLDGFWYFRGVGELPMYHTWGVERIGGSPNDEVIFVDWCIRNSWDGYWVSVTATRRPMAARNALGLAMAKDLEKQPTHETVTNVARSVVNSVWDASLGVAWEARMHNGHLYYIAVTNKPPEVK